MNARTFRVLRPFPVAALLVLGTLVGPARAEPPPPTAEELRRELNQLRSEYESRIRALERQLDQLERGAVVAAPAPGVAPVPVPATPVPPPSTSAPAPGAAVVPLVWSDAAAQQRQWIEDQFKGTTESRDIAREQDRQSIVQKRIEQILQDFVDFTGYFRAGYGRNDEGGIQTPFRAPGAQSKYRLGNETENYGELALGKSFYVPGLFSGGERDAIATGGDPLSGPIARFQFRLAFSNPYSGGTDLTVPEAWASIGNVIPSKPDAKFWAGNRFYRRHDIHISDFFFYNMSGKGGGLEDFDIGIGKLALAWIGESSQDATYGDLILPDPVNESGFAKSSWDLRLYDVELPLGKGEFGMSLARAEGGQDELGDRVEDAYGMGFNFVHTAEGFLDERSINKFSLQFGTGPARTFNAGFEVYESNGGFYILPELDDSWRVRLTEHLILQPCEWLSYGPALVYEYTDFGQQDAFGGTRHWLSAGFRPIFHFTRNVSLALEGGVDWTDTDGRIDSAPDGSGALWKITIAPQVSLDRFFLSRPSIRLYLTYAGWTDAFRGAVGGTDYLDRTEGLAYGIQMETWW